MFSKPIILFAFCLIGFSLEAQKADSAKPDSLGAGRILLMNGKELRGNILEKDMGQVTYEHSVQGAWEEDAMAKGRIFSIDPAKDPEQIFYEQDSSIGDLLDRQEMRYFIYGQQDARGGYRAPLATVGGIVLGGAGAYLLKFSVFTFAVPLVYTLGSTVPNIKVDKGTVSDQAYLEREFYLKGYERQARNHRLLNAIKGSVGGALLGMGIYALINPDQLR